MVEKGLRGSDRPSPGSRIGGQSERLSMGRQESWGSDGRLINRRTESSPGAISIREAPQGWHAAIYRPVADALLMHLRLLLS